MNGGVPDGLLMVPVTAKVTLIRDVVVVSLLLKKTLIVMVRIVDTDRAGVCGGTAELDECSLCFGGDTEITTARLCSSNYGKLQTFQNTHRCISLLFWSSVDDTDTLSVSRLEMYTIERQVDTDMWAMAGFLVQLIIKKNMYLVTT